MSDVYLKASSSPHIRAKKDVRVIMRDVVIALLPALIVSIYYFGMDALILTLISIFTAVISETLIEKIMKKPITINDWSAVVTGMLLAFNLPSTAPWWLAVIGSAFAILIVKHAFGGLGQNFVNPALAARAFLLSSWGTRMTAFEWPDIVGTATPLGMLATGEGQLPSYLDLFLGNVAGCLGETSAIALLLGGCYLLYRKVITWKIPVVYLATVGVITFIVGSDPIYHLLSGGLMLGAIFMATDYATSPSTSKGQIIYALGCGILTSIIRLWGGYPEGVSYSILLMNVATPIIDKFIVPKVYGEVKSNA